MLKAFKYRIYPTKEQEVLIAKHIGSTRFLYNLALETKQMAYAGSKVNLSGFDIAKQIPDLKLECPWLKEINSQSLQKAIANMDSAFNNFFKGRADFPKYKSKGSSRQSFNVPQSVEVDIETSLLHIPKFKGGIDIRLHRPLKGELKQATISRTPTGKYFASILAETGQAIPEKKPVSEQTAVGLDLGLKTLIVASDGTMFDNPKHMKEAMARLKYLQSRYSRFKGKTTKKKLAKAHEEVANKRRDLLHKLSSQLVKNHDSIAIEDLNIQGMMARCKPKQDENGKYLPNGQAAKSGLNKSIADAGWGMFVEMLEYKAEWQGKNILRIGRFEPSSKTCSCCGWIYKDLTLEEREWTCKGCGVVHDRDVNAAKNIKAFALEKSTNKTVCGTQTKTQSELPTLVGALTSEAHGSLAHG
jgi:putative transposase